MKRLSFNFDFCYGDEVYLKCDDDCDPGIITGVQLSGEDWQTGILYAVAWGSRAETRHFGVELSYEPCPRYPKPEKGENAET